MTADPRAEVWLKVFVMEPPTDERGYLIDPNNPWPRGSDWWLMHNERYTKSQWCHPPAPGGIG